MITCKIQDICRIMAISVPTTVPQKSYKERFADKTKGFPHKTSDFHGQEEDPLN